MSNGYDQFFKQARQAATTAPVKKSLNKTQKKIVVRPPQKVTTKKSSLKAILLSTLGFALTTAAVLNFDELEKSLSKIEFSLGPQALASSKAETTKSAASGKETNREPAQVVAVAGSGTTADVATAAVAAQPVDESHLGKLVERSQQLDIREEELKRVEAEIEKQKKEIEQKIAELEQARIQITAELGEKVKVDDAKIDTLVQLYTNMKAPQAARVIETIDEDLAIEVLSRMKKKSAADIMNLMKPEKAQMLSEKYAGYKKK